MKMIRAIIRCEQEDKVIKALEKANFFSYTRWEVIGRGKQKGIKKGNFHYLELYKTCLMIVVKEKEVSQVISLIQKAAKTGKMGDGKVFITPVESTWTIRTGKEGL